MHVLNSSQSIFYVDFYAQYLHPSLEEWWFLPSWIKCRARLSREHCDYCITQWKHCYLHSHCNIVLKYIYDLNRKGLESTRPSQCQSKSPFSTMLCKIVINLNLKVNVSIYKLMWTWKENVLKDLSREVNLKVAFDL